MSQDLAAGGKPNAFDTIVYGGLAVGVLDFLDASIFFPLYYGITFQRVWNGVAAGIFGRDAAREGGWSTALIGILLHFVVAFGVAAVYYFASRKISFLLRHPIICGLIYGVIVNFAMQWVVIPLSAIGPRTTSEPIGSLLNSIIGHALLVGLPVALIAAWSARRNVGRLA